MRKYYGSPESPFYTYLMAPSDVELYYDFLKKCFLEEEKFPEDNLAKEIEKTSLIFGAWQEAVKLVKREGAFFILFHENEPDKPAGLVQLKVARGGGERITADFTGNSPCLCFE